MLLEMLHNYDGMINRVLSEKEYYDARAEEWLAYVKELITSLFTHTNDANLIKFGISMLRQHADMSDDEFKDFVKSNAKMNHITLPSGINWSRHS